MLRQNSLYFALMVSKNQQKQSVIQNIWHVFFRQPPSLQTLISLLDHIIFTIAAYYFTTNFFPFLMYMPFGRAFTSYADHLRPCMSYMFPSVGNMFCVGLLMPVR